MNLTTDWQTLSPESFEKLCTILLDKNGFTNVQWHGAKGADRGRDIVCEKITEPLPGVTRVEKWLVQCKRYTDKRISKAELNALLVAAREHKPDTVLLIITDTLNSALKDWVQEAQHDFDFSVLIWEEFHLRRQVAQHWKDFADLFPELSPKGELVTFYKVDDNCVTLICNDFQEVEFRVINTDNYKRACEQVRALIEYLRTNQVTFDRRTRKGKLTPGKPF